MNFIKCLFSARVPRRSATEGCASVCPVCGVPCGLQFTSGKGKPYLACDKHKVQAILLKFHGDPRKSTS